MFKIWNRTNKSDVNAIIDKKPSMRLTLIQKKYACLNGGVRESSQSIDIYLSTLMEW